MAARTIVLGTSPVSRAFLAGPAADLAYALDVTLTDGTVFDVVAGGLGETGETVLLNKDGVFISDSVKTDENEVLNAKLELPLDIPNKAVQDPWNQDEDIRIAKVGLKGRFGNVAVGQMWMPYYNAIAYPVDMFSSYYSGFATFTSFRKDGTVAYYTPSFAGFSAAASYSSEAGAAKAS